MLVRHRCELVIASVGSPEHVIGPLHDAGCLVYADIASVRHAEKAIAAGSDGLVLLTAGAGGQTGWANPFAFARAVRAIWGGPMVMAGGIADGQALYAAEALGCDFAYMGTKFIATQESMAPDGYKRMLVQSGLDDIVLSRAFTGLETNTLRSSILAAGPRSRGTAGARDAGHEQGHQQHAAETLERHLERRAFGFRGYGRAQRRHADRAHAGGVCQGEGATLAPLAAVRHGPPRAATRSDDGLTRGCIGLSHLPPNEIHHQPQRPHRVRRRRVGRDEGVRHPRNMCRSISPPASA